MSAAVFLDRDGTIIEDADYPRDPSRVRLLPGAIRGLKELSEKGYLLFLVSNQSGVGRGIIPMAAYLAVRERFEQLLSVEGVVLANSFYCLHAPDEACPCRKPAIGLVPREHQGKRLDWTTSFVVGDKSSDVGLARAIGASAFLVRTGKGEQTRQKEPDAIKDAIVVADLLEMSQHVPARP